ncbi:MAG: hypothetical protein Kow00108_07630 [Calditrichia bacterium]
MENKINISAETKIGELLDVFPQLENYLIQLAPAYKNLKNPILRKTVAKVATLGQVARVGNMKSEALVNKICDFLQIEGEVVQQNTEQQTEIPGNLTIVDKIDARPMLARNEHPVGVVINKLKTLKANQGFELVTPFVPAPLLDKIEENNGKAVCVKIDDEEFLTTIWI